MKRSLLNICTLLLAILSQAQTRQLKSPDGRIILEFTSNGKFTYQVKYNDQQLVDASLIDLELKDAGLISTKAVLKKSSVKSVTQSIISPVPEKRKIIRDHYNELIIEFKQPFSIVFRAYNDGIAYRFVTRFKDSIVITNETAGINLTGNPALYFTPVKKRADADIFHTSFEENYEIKTADSIKQQMIFTPLLVKTAAGPKLVITESDLEDYPGMFITGNASQKLAAAFAGYPEEERITAGEFPQAVVTKRAAFIAKTQGTRSFPWRVIAIAAEDRQLPSNDIVYRLASPSRLQDHSWIKPGKGTDEWIIGINLFNVPFKAGINTATYKYYIDFAKRFGFDRIMMDAGWSDYKDLFRIHPDIDMKEISRYAKEKNIGLSMWTLASTLESQLDAALKQFQSWGVDFIMTDFMDRDDQKMMQFYHRVAKACADARIMVMYHGAFKPAGFNRTYPNAVTREGVLGSEFNIWSDRPTPDHNLLLPFIRMVAGPMDYEPGLLDNATKKTFRPIEGKVMSSGTRCHQLAMFVVYESPIQIFSGNPSQGYSEPAFMELLGSIPTTWDETIIPQAKLGEYIITARKKGDDWFVGAMSNWDARALNLKLDFLSEGNYSATICEDGVNADRYASDYKLSEKILSASDTVPIRLAPGGGYLLRLRKLK